MRNFLIVMVAIFLASNVLADVQITIKEGDGRVSTISSDGKKARIEDLQDPGYVIIDYAAREFLMVDPKRKEVLQASMGKAGVAVTGSSGVSIDLQDKGGGPIIAGYATRKHAFLANGTPCGTIYASRKLLENSAVRGLFESMRAMEQQSRRMMSGMGGILGLCEQAQLYLFDALDSAGAPMRIIDANGKLESEVLKVDTDKNFAGSHYRPPAGMKRVSMEEKIGETAQQSEEMMKNMPDMSEMLQQLEQSGQQIPEDAMEQLKQLQQQLEGLQQQ